ncbi:MAG: 50S ribosomal protein L31 [Candidatus Omnitrophica bacterium]|nr:50S ribosomal protein L31 [Candidatus Omnitrophota bacterium]
MKTEIHPEYGPVTLQCACGNSFQTQSTIKGSIRVDVCSSCHPFFTGKQKVMDIAGRIDRFNKKFVSGAAPAPVKKPKAPEQAFGAKLSIREKLQAAKDKAAIQNP